VNLWSGIKQRKIATWTAAYLAAAWVLVQVVALVGDQFDWSPAIGRALTILLAFGVPIVLILAWQHGERGRQRATPLELILVAALLFTGITVAWRVGRADHRPPANDELDAQPAIAVLPFKDISPQRDQSYLSDGIAEELINALANVPGLRVASARSSFGFRDSERPLRDIARELHVDVVLEGAVRQQGNRLRVTANLTNAENGFHLWSQVYDRDLSDVFAVQEEIARRIAERLEVDLAAAAAKKAVRSHTADMRAYEHYLRGRELTRAASYESLQLAIKQFELALARDPNLAAAHAGLADVYLILGFNYVEPRTVLPAFEDNARKALALDERLANAHMALAYATIAGQGNWATALVHAQRAVALNRQNADVRAFHAVLLAYAGQPVRAFAETDSADLLDPARAFTTVDRALVLFFTRRYAEAEKHLQQMLALLPGFPRANLWLGWTFAARGQYDEAIKAYQRERAVGSTADAYMAHAHALAGRRDTALAIVRDLVRRSETEFVDAHRIATAYVGLGDHEAALRWLDRAFEQKSFHLMTLNTDPFMDPLRGDPRFPALLQRAGFGR